MFMSVFIALNMKQHNEASERTGCTSFVRICNEREDFFDEISKKIN